MAGADDDKLSVLQQYSACDVCFSRLSPFYPCTDQSWQVSDALLKLEKVPKDGTAYAGYLADIGEPTRDSLKNNTQIASLSFSFR